MPVVQITPAFEDALKILGPDRQTAARSFLALLARNPDDPSLDLRPFRTMEGYWIIDSIWGDRILLRRESDDLYAAVDVGGHEMCARWGG